MKRIFFIYDQNELQDQEVKEILTTQCNIGVEVYVTDASKAHAHLRRFVMIENEGRIAWEAHIGPDGKITHVVATSNQEVIISYERMFKELFGLSGTRRYP